MQPRGTRIACSLRTTDGASGTFSVYPGDAPKTTKGVEAVQWDKPASGDIVEAVFAIIGELGMTGQLIVLTGEKWRALTKAKLENHFYAALLWGGSPLKVVDDALLIARRSA